MPIITKIEDFNGFAKKIERLELIPLVNEALGTITSFQLTLAENPMANGTRGIRQSIDSSFEKIGGWKKLTSGGVDWTKQNDRGATIGVEVQVSGRSDMLAVDIMHLKDDISEGRIDVGLIVVPDDQLSKFLTDRTPNFATALKHVNHRAKDLPIRVAAFRHDGVGDALPKMRTNLGKYDN